LVLGKRRDEWACWLSAHGVHGVRASNPMRKGTPAIRKRSNPIPALPNAGGGTRKVDGHQCRTPRLTARTEKILPPKESNGAGCG
jgi:hypothetical protein